MNDSQVDSRSIGLRDAPTLADRTGLLNRRRALGWLGFCATTACHPRWSFGQSASTGSTTKDLMTPATARSIEAGLSFLMTKQNEDGSFGSGAYGRNVAVASLCGMAFVANGSSPGRGPYGAAIDRTINFVQSQASESGLINHPASSNRGPMYGHGFATLFLAEMYGMSLHPQLRDQLSRATALIVSTQNDAGGWRYQPRRDDADISVTVCQLMALRAARNAGVYVPHVTVDRAVAFVKDCQNPDGGFTYRLDDGGESAFPRSAAALVALNSAGIYEGEEIRKGLEYLMQFPPSADAFGKKSYYFYGQYYAVQAMWHARGGYWEAWYPAIRDVLQRMQDGQDGGWPSPISREFGTAMACLVQQMPQNYLPIFQR